MILNLIVAEAPDHACRAERGSYRLSIDVLGGHAVALESRTSPVNTGSVPPQSFHLERDHSMTLQMCLLAVVTSSTASLLCCDRMLSSDCPYWPEEHVLRTMLVTRAQTYLHASRHRIC